MYVVAPSNNTYLCRSIPADHEIYANFGKLGDAPV